MAFVLTTPVTGQPQTGFTSPTFTIAADTPPAVNAKQYVITALGGTQTGASASLVSSPFTVSMFRPAVYASAGQLDANNVLRGVGYNDYAIIVRKGMVPLAGQPPMLATFTLKMHVPAGADSVSSGAEIKSALSLLFGAAVQTSAGIGDTLVSGVL